VLNALVETAYRQNPSLCAAGVRVLEAQAQRGITIGQLFPQQQEAFGTYSCTALSENKANRATLGLQTTFDDWQLGVARGPPTRSSRTHTAGALHCRTP